MLDPLSFKEDFKRKWLLLYDIFTTSTFFIYYHKFINQHISKKNGKSKNSIFLFNEQENRNFENS